MFAKLDVVCGVRPETTTETSRGSTVHHERDAPSPPHHGDARGVKLHRNLCTRLGGRRKTRTSRPRVPHSVRRPSRPGTLNMPRLAAAFGATRHETAGTMCRPYPALWEGPPTRRVLPCSSTCMEPGREHRGARLSAGRGFVGRSPTHEGRSALLAPPRRRILIRPGPRRQYRHQSKYSSRQARSARTDSMFMWTPFGSPCDHPQSAMSCPNIFFRVCGRLR